MSKNVDPRLKMFSTTSVTVSPVSELPAITEQTLQDLEVPVARRVAFVRVVLASGAAFLALAGWLPATGYLGPQLEGAGAMAVLLVTGSVLVLAAAAMSWAFNARKTLRRPKFIYPAKTPETVADAWIGVGLMAAVAAVILGVVAIFGGDSWAERLSSIVAALPLALLGPGIAAGIFLITGYTMGNSETIFRRWLSKRPLAQTEYAELVSAVRNGQGPDR